MPPVRKPPARMSREAGGAGQAGRAGIAAKKGKRTNGELEKGRRAGVKVPEALSKERLLDAYRTMFTARKTDDKILLLLKQGKVFFHIGGSGHEAVQVATARLVRCRVAKANPLDAAEHAYVSARTVSLGQVVVRQRRRSVVPEPPPSSARCRRERE